MITGKQFMGLSGIPHNSVGKNSEAAFCDDGYFGGEEFGSGNDDEIFSSDNDDSPVIEALSKEYLQKNRSGLTYQEYGKSDNIDGCYGAVPDDRFGDISEDEEAENVPVNATEDELENQEGDNNQHKCFSTEQIISGGKPLGDCGCVTGHNGDEDSGDDEETDEEEVALADTDLQQEIYTDKSQIGVPYKKRLELLLLITHFLIC
jgi:hypothetical protein